MKTMADYGRPKSQGVVRGRGARVRRSTSRRSALEWEFGLSVIKDAGDELECGHRNRRGLNQQELPRLHQGLVPLLGRQHAHQVESLLGCRHGGQVTESLGYKALSIEVARHEGVRIVYNTIRQLA